MELIQLVIAGILGITGWLIQIERRFSRLENRLDLIAAKVETNDQLTQKEISHIRRTLDEITQSIHRLEQKLNERN